MPTIYVGPEEIKTAQTLAGQLFCPRCTAAFADNGISSAFWRADDSVYFSWCRKCGWLGDIVEISFVTTLELNENETNLPY